MKRVIAKKIAWLQGHYAGSVKVSSGEEASFKKVGSEFFFTSTISDHSINKTLS